MQMKNVVMLFGSAALVVGYLAIPSPSFGKPDDAMVKCGVPPVIFLHDGRVLDADQFNSIDSKTIVSLAVTCTDVRHLIFGVENGRQLILSWTNAPPARELESSMDAIASLQEAHFRQHRTYARSLAELGWGGSTRVSLCVSEDGLRWKLLVADETGGASLAGGRDYSSPDRNSRFSCDVRYADAEEILHWVSGEK